MTPGAAGQRVVIAAFGLKKREKKKKTIPGKKGVIHHYTTGVMETAARICINQGRFTIETTS